MQDVEGTTIILLTVLCPAFNDLIFPPESTSRL